MLTTTQLAEALVSLHLLLSTACPPKHALDLVPLLKLLGMSQVVENMTNRIQPMQEEVRQKLDVTNAKYKEAGDKKRRKKIFSVRDLERKGFLLVPTIS